MPDSPSLDQFPASDFDAWAPGYDQSVGRDSGFPFDGYSRVIRTIEQLANLSPGDAVLDLGIGTGNLAALFASRGCQVWGLDFSAKMIDLAQLKLPQARLAQVDIRAEWPAEFQRHYHAVVSGYTFHHFLLEDKVKIVHTLLANYTFPGGVW